MVARKDPAYLTLHNRVRKIRGPAYEHTCAGGCGNPGQQWATVHGYDGYDLEDYVPMCIKCHIRYDRAPQLAIA